MKKIALASAFLLVNALGSAAMGACRQADGTLAVGWSQVEDLYNTLKDKTVCGGGSQEEHHDDYQLWDYKCGDFGSYTTSVDSNDPCYRPASDPRSKMGTWEVTGSGSSAAVIYHYTEHGNYDAGPFTVFENGGTYDFCAGDTSVGTFTLKPTLSGSKACP